MELTPKTEYYQSDFKNFEFDKQKNDFKSDISSPIDIATLANSNVRQSILDKIINKKTGVMEAWSHNIYVYRDYKNFKFFPPEENLYAEQMDSSETRENDNFYIRSDSSKNTGLLKSNIASKVFIFHENHEIKSGIFIHLKARHDDIGQFGAMSILPRIEWSSLNVFNIGTKYYAGSRHTKNSVVITVEQKIGVDKNGNNLYEPLVNYQEKEFLIHEYNLNRNDISEPKQKRLEENGKINTGDIEHSFLAHNQYEYRIGIIAKVELNHTVSDFSGSALPNDNNLFFFSTLNFFVKNIVIRSVAYVK